MALYDQKFKHRPESLDEAASNQMLPSYPICTLVENQTCQFGENSSTNVPITMRLEGGKRISS